MPPAIPDRWADYKACGKVIEGTKIICFKVPLRKTLQMGTVDKCGIWDIRTLRLMVPDLGAVIDLTNTNRYYNPEDLITRGVLHRKILIPGRVMPPENKVKQFMDTVDEFLGRIGDKVIGVHCTHGLNRTGYMVCRYMRDRLQLPANLAIKKFEKARGYQIERENYTADLLGQTPPPPHFGSHTQVKPIGHGGHSSHRGNHSGYNNNSRYNNGQSTKRGRSNSGSSYNNYQSEDYMEIIKARKAGAKRLKELVNKT